MKRIGLILWALSLCLVSCEKGDENVVRPPLPGAEIDDIPTFDDPQKNALAQLYRSTKGTDWLRNDNWCTDRPLDEWYGVTTDGKGQVTDIHLDGNNLCGPIPEGLAALSGLNTLVFRNNRITGPLPEDLTETKLWQRQWGDILFGNLVPKQAFVDLKMTIPEEIQADTLKSRYAFYLQWFPQKSDNMTDQQYTKDSLVVDSFRLVALDIPVCGRCFGIGEAALADTLAKRQYAWKNVQGELVYPISTEMTAWIFVNDKGEIIDTNLLEDDPVNRPSGQLYPNPGQAPNPDTDDDTPTDASSVLDAAGKKPGYVPLRVTAQMSNWKIACGPQLNTSYSVNGVFLYGHPTVVLYCNETRVGTLSLSSNKNDELLSYQLVSYQNWHHCYGDNIVVNGNDSVSARSGYIYVNVFYAGHYYNSFKLPVQQDGVVFECLTSSDIGQWQFFEGDAEMNELLNLPRTTSLGLSPYPGTHSFRFRTNAGYLFNPLSNTVSAPQRVTGISTTADFVPPQMTVQQDGDVFQLDFSWTSNRTVSYKGYIVLTGPMVQVIENWNAPSESVSFHYVNNASEGRIEAWTMAMAQTPVCIYAEYDSYVAEPVAVSGGRNLFQVYTDDYLSTPVADHVKIWSAVDWKIRDMSLEDEDWQYDVINTEPGYTGNGRTFGSSSFELYVVDYLKEKTTLPTLGNTVYRPAVPYPTRRTNLHLSVDLHDGLAPAIIDVAALYQIGLPYVSDFDYQSNMVEEGEYYFKGKKYKYAYPFDVSVYNDMDAATRLFCKKAELYFKTGDLENWYEVTLANRLDVQCISYNNMDIDDEHLMGYFDYRVKMRNGVYVWSGIIPQFELGVVQASKSVLPPVRLHGKTEMPVVCKKQSKRVSTANLLDAAQVQ